MATNRPPSSGSKSASPPTEPIRPPGTGGVVPGYDYLQRVAGAGFGALMAQAEIMNAAWAAVKGESYSVARWLKDGANMVETFSDALAEVARGPGYVSRPAWLHFNYDLADPANQPTELKFPARIDRYESPQALLDYTEFTGLAGGQHQSLYRVPPSWVGSRRTEIMVELNVDAVKAAAVGDYMSFVFCQGRSAEPPLVIVALHVRG